MEISLTLDMDNIMPATRATVLELLKKKNMSVGEYSMKSGLSKQTIDNLLNGKSKSIKPDTLVQLIRGFDMSYNQFAALVLSHGRYSVSGEQ